jgi:Concanavalin A-like lectin/glucanases superfamily
MVGCGKVASEELPDAAPTVDGRAQDPDLTLWLPMVTAPVAGRLENAVGNGWVATCTPSCPTIGAGIQGAALVFDGVSTGLRVSLNGFDARVGTMAAWVRVDQAPTSYQTLFAKPFGTNDKNTWELIVEPVASAMPLLKWGGDALTPNYVSLTYPRPFGTWMHVATTWSATTGETALFVDGSRVEAKALAVSVDGSDLFLGADNNGGTIEARMRGAMDEVRLYRRVLSAAEIVALAARP